MAAAEAAPAAAEAAAASVFISSWFHPDFILIHPDFILVSAWGGSLSGLDIQTARQNFKRPKNREDSSDLDENLTDRIAAMKSIISKIFGAARLQKNCF